MSFLESYKRIEKLCNEEYNAKNGLTLYIEEMEYKSDGQLWVPDWSSDLKNLKHYRWIRNMITHEPSYTEDNMCLPGDEAWLNDFYTRMINANDPLSLYRLETARRSAPKKASQDFDNYQNTYKNYSENASQNRQKSSYTPQKRPHYNSSDDDFLQNLMIVLLFLVLLAIVVFLFWQLSKLPF